MCLDFTHTGGDGEEARWEILHEPADVARFLGIITETEPPIVGQSDLGAVFELRRAIAGVARARVADEQVPSGHIPVINDAASQLALIPQLNSEGHQQLLPGTAMQALATIARDAIDLFSSELVDRIKICEADDCGLLFVDTSRPRNRRWCSMEWCGDRAKKRSAGRPVRKGTMP